MAGGHSRLVASLALVVMLALGTLIVTVPEAGGSYENPPDPRNIQIYSETLGSSTRYAGDQDINFYVRVRNASGDELTDDNPIQHCNASIGNMVCDEKGNVVDSPILNWDTQEVNDDVSIYEGNYYYFQGFQLDLQPDCKPMTYNLTFCLRYETSAGVVGVFIGYIHFDVMSRITVSKVTGLYAGDHNREFSVTTYISPSIRDPRLVLETPDPDFSWFGTADRFMSASRTGTTSGYWYPLYTISVSNDKAPGTFKTTFTFQYKNSVDLLCTERGEVEFEVGGVPVLGADMYDNVVEQGAHDVRLTALLSNDGNVNLYEVSVSIAEPSRTYFRPKADHYEGTAAIGTTRYAVGSLLLQDTTSVTMDLTVDPRTPAGEHRVLLDVSGVFYDPISGSYRAIDMDWYYDINGAYATLDVGPTTIALTPEHSGFTGPSFTVKVQDPAVDIELLCHSDVCAGRLLRDGIVEVEVTNNGQVTYGNVAVRLPTNRDTSPFISRSDPKSGLSEAGTLSTTLGGGETAVVQVPVRLKEGIMPGPFRCEAEVYAVDLDMGEPMTTKAMLLVNVRGMGPLLQVTDVEPTEIPAGKDFTMRLIITNVGDETATLVMLGRPVADVDGAGTGPYRSDATSINGDTAPPEPEFLPIRLEDIEPSDWVAVDLPMRVNPDMVAGHVYKLQFGLEYLDPYGDRPDTAGQVQEVTVKAKGEPVSVEGELYSSVNTVIWLLAIGFLVIVAFVALGQVSAMRSRQAAARRDAARDAPSTAPAEPRPQPQGLPETQVYAPSQQQPQQEPQQQQNAPQQPGVQSGYGQPPQQGIQPGYEHPPQP